MEKSKFMMIVIIALLVLLLATVVGVSFYVLSLVRNQQANVQVEESPTEQVVKQLSPSEITSISLGEPITTNLAGKSKTAESAEATEKPSTSDRYAKVEVAIGYDNTLKKESTAFAESFAESISIARSLALDCIYRKSYEELSEPDGWDLLAAEILTVLQEKFETTMIVEVYIIEHIIL